MYTPPLVLVSIAAVTGSGTDSDMGIEVGKTQHQSYKIHEARIQA
jgi:hypothetical protein